jgi:guanylate kinase
MVETHGFTQIKTATTRPIRPGEDPDSYYFLTKAEFGKLGDSGEIAEFTSYPVVGGDIWYYGSLKASYEGDGDKVVVLNPIGMSMIKHLYPEAISVYLKAPLDVLVRRGLGRGDDPVELCRRLITDAATFRTLESWGGLLLVIDHKEGQSVTDIYERMGV